MTSMNSLGLSLSMGKGGWTSYSKLAGTAGGRDTYRVACREGNNGVGARCRGFFCERKKCLYTPCCSCLSPQRRQGHVTESRCIVPNSLGSLQYAKIKRNRAFNLCEINKNGATCRATSGNGTSADLVGSISTTFDVLQRDIKYLEEKTGLDLRSSLDSVASAHELVVALLNPVAGAVIAENLEQQVASLQKDLEVAHNAIHKSEESLEETLARLSDLQDSVCKTLSVPKTEIRLGINEDDENKDAMVTHTRHMSNSFSRKRSNSKSLIAGKSLVGLHSSIDIESELADFWYPVCFTSKLLKGQVNRFELLGFPLLLFRNKNGDPICQLDTEASHITECGSCEMIFLPTAETDGLIWLHPAVLNNRAAGNLDGKIGPVSVGQHLSQLIADNEVMQLSAPEGYSVHAELVMEVPVDHGLLLENLLDLAHAPFTHTTTFAKGWPIPESVRFHTAQLLGGSWRPYPIDMSFAPPVMVLSTIGLAQPGKIETGLTASKCNNHLHQMHVCLPSKPGHTLLLYRMSLDFLGWTRFIPGIEKFWEYIAKQVLGEDLVLVKGQQDRLLRGGNTWGHPVAYDKLGVRYRRWRNSLKANENQTKNNHRELRPQMKKLRKSMSAEELFLMPLDET